MADSKKDVKVKISGEDGTKPAFDSAEKNAKGFGASVKNLVSALGIEKVLEKIGEKVAEFFKGVAEEGMAAERTQKMLANTFRNTGADVASSMAAAEEAIGKVARASGQADDEIAAALNNMVLKSGDVHASLAALPVVADLAAGANISLAEASDVVGRALAGQTRGLKQFGIVTSDAHAGLDQLAKRFHGAAATDLSTFSGAMRAAENATKEAQEELGLAIIQTPYFQKGVREMTADISKFAEWLETNRAQIGYWASVIVGAVKLVAVETYNLGVALGAAMGWVVAEVLLQTVRVTNGINTILAAGYAKMGMYSKAAETLAGNTSTAGLERSVADAKAAGDAATTTMRTSWDAFSDLVQRGADDTAEKVGKGVGKITRVATEAELAAAQKRLDEFNKEVARASAGFLKQIQTNPDFGTKAIDPSDPNKGPLAGDLGMGHGIDLGDVTAGIPTGIIAAESGFDHLKDNLHEMEPALAKFADAFSSAFTDIGSGAVSMGKGLQQAGKAAIAGLANAEGQLMQAKAAAALAEGFMGNPAAFAAAAEYEVAAAAFFAIGGAVGGGRRNAGGGSGTGRQVYDDTATNRLGASSVPAAATLAAPRAAVNVTLIGPNDPKAGRELVALINNAIGNGHKVGI